ncbi:Hypothetical protein NTJ_02329 [Nesidiocoris tenuis]|uniref:Uncharacterized protein n=1 Tax=Nesidiocoris tenuis TaxID=355587 RepID=A0ABN7AE47_9HEMI|nr:Hypothetical protein NTJ_02329 [Nesidiocoris tenuis]
MTHFKIPPSLTSDSPFYYHHSLEERFRECSSPHLTAICSSRSDFLRAGGNRKTTVPPIRWSSKNQNSDSLHSTSYYSGKLSVEIVTDVTSCRRRLLLKDRENDVLAADGRPNVTR